MGTTAWILIINSFCFVTVWIYTSWDMDKKKFELFENWGPKLFFSIFWELYILFWILFWLRLFDSINLYFIKKDILDIIEKHAFIIYEISQNPKRIKELDGLKDDLDNILEIYHKKFKCIRSYKTSLNNEIKIIISKQPTKIESIK